MHDEARRGGAKAVGSVHSGTQGKDKDAPLFDDIRLLGRLLGDVVREQAGEAVYAVVETVRQAAVQQRKEADAQAGQALDAMLAALDAEQVVAVVRAFSFFGSVGISVFEPYTARWARRDVWQRKTPGRFRPSCSTACWQGEIQRRFSIPRD